MFNCRGVVGRQSLILACVFCYLHILHIFASGNGGAGRGCGGVEWVVGVTFACLHLHADVMLRLRFGAALLSPNICTYEGRHENFNVNLTPLESLHDLEKLL